MVKEKRTTHYILAAAFIVVAVFIDQITKLLAIERLKGQQPFVIWENVFQLEYLENRGAAFGLFQNQRVFFYLSVAFICVLFVWFYKKVPLNRHFFPLRLCAVFVVAGAIGNCIDRVRLNYVVDFFYIKLIDFPIFNVADLYVTMSTIVLALLIFFFYKEEDLEQIFHSRKRGGRED